MAAPAEYPRCWPCDVGPSRLTSRLWRLQSLCLVIRISFHSSLWPNVCAQAKILDHSWGITFQVWMFLFLSSCHLVIHSLTAWLIMVECFLDGLDVPYHPGNVVFYCCQGIFFVKPIYSFISSTPNLIDLDCKNWFFLKIVHWMYDSSWTVVFIWQYWNPLCFMSTCCFWKLPP